MAYVGASAFAHKGGLHVSAVKKDPKTYEHIDPTLIGNSQKHYNLKSIWKIQYYLDLKSMEYRLTLKIQKFKNIR